MKPSSFGVFLFYSSSDVTRLKRRKAFFLKMIDKRDLFRVFFLHKNRAFSPFRSGPSSNANIFSRFAA